MNLKGLTRTVALLGFVLMMLPLAGCSGGSMDGDTGTIQNTSTQPVSVTVNILGNRFDPNYLTIPAGSTVTWHNTTSADHGITCNQFNASLSPGQDYVYTFNNTGRYEVTSSSHTQGTGLRVEILVE